MSKYPVGVVALLALAFTSLGMAARSPSTADTGRSVASRVASTASGDCSKAAALQVATRVQVGVDPTLPNPIAGVLCGAFAGPGSRVMIATIANGTCWPNIGWAAFRFAGGAWQLIPGRHDAVEALAAVGSDIRETVPIWRKSDGPCNPTGGTKTRVWHWNGTRLVAGPWGQPQSKPRNEDEFYSPSHNIACGMYDNSSDRFVYCQSQTPPQTVRMDAAGRLSICHDPTPNATSPNECNTGNAGEGTPTLAYGRQITVGRFRCLSLQIGVRCTVIQSGKGFLINRDGVTRVGP